METKHKIFIGGIFDWILMILLGVWLFRHKTFKTKKHHFIGLLVTFFLNMIGWAMTAQRFVWLESLNGVDFNQKQMLLKGKLLAIILCFVTLVVSHFKRYNVLDIICMSWAMIFEILNEGIFAIALRAP